jgi:hypothetical protein
VPAERLSRILVPINSDVGILFFKVYFSSIGPV